MYWEIAGTDGRVRAITSARDRRLERPNFDCRNITTDVCLLETSLLSHAYLKHHHWRMLTWNITTGVCLLKKLHWCMLIWNSCTGICLLGTVPLAYAYLKHNCHMLTWNITTSAKPTWNITTGAGLLETSPLAYANYKHHQVRRLTKTSLAYAYLKHCHWCMLTWNITTVVC